jgi:hydrogenase 3 maturation protease
VDFYSLLEQKLRARIGMLSPDCVVIVGVGNRMRGDDAIGPAVIDRLTGKVPHAIDAGSAPENVTGAIKKLKPRAIVLVDALIFKDLPPGAPQIVEIADIEHIGESTHTLSLDVVMEYLKMETGADVFLIGVQPGRIAEGESLSQGMEEKMSRLASAILASIGKR